MTGMQCSAIISPDDAVQLFLLMMQCSYFSCWWAHSRPKHVEKRNKHTKKNCSPSWLYLQDYTGTHGQQNIKFRKRVC